MVDPDWYYEYVTTGISIHLKGSSDRNWPGVGTSRENSKKALFDLLDLNHLTDVIDADATEVNMGRRIRIGFIDSKNSIFNSSFPGEFKTLSGEWTVEEKNWNY